MEQNSVLKLPNCFVDVSKNNHDIQQLFQILIHLKPKWTEKDTMCTELSGGYANLTLKCSAKANPEDCVVFRIWNQTFSSQFKAFVNRKTEAEMIQILGEVGVAPKLYAVFKNGLCYEFIDGEILTPAQCKTDEVAKLIAGNFAKIHKTKLESSSEAQTMNIINFTYENYPIQHPDKEKNKILQDSLPSKEEMGKEIEFLEEYVKQLQCPLVLCHADPHAKNMIANKKTEKIVFVDYELSHVSYQPQDLVTFLLLLTVDYDDFSKGMFSGELPDKAFQYKFLRWYLEEWFEISGKNASEVTQKDVEKLYIEVAKYTLFTFFLYAMIYFCMHAVETKDAVHEDMVTLDFSKLGIKHLEMYFKKKEDLMSLQIPKELDALFCL